MKTPQILIDELLKRKVIDEQSLGKLAQEASSQDSDIGRLLIENKLISEEDLLKIKSDVYKIPSIDISKADIPKETLLVISEDVANFYKFVPFEKKDDVLKVGLLNPEDIDALEALKFIASDQGFSVEKYLISYLSFDYVIKKYKSLSGEVKEALDELGQELSKAEIKAKEAAPSAVLSEEAPITRAVAVIVRHAVDGRASDIHIEPMEDKLRVRFRVDGILQTAIILPKNLHSAIVTKIKILTDLKIDETRLPQDGRFSTRIDNKKIDFRVSTLPSRHGEKVVMRILDPLAGLVDLPELGLAGRNLDLILKSIDKPFGSILITGPTGSGKTTTLYAILRRVSTEGVNVMTLEDPIEFLIEGVNQSQVQEEINYTFATGLRHFLRQDPDIIMVGEIRDSETAALATHAALTGHLVFSTLHTNDAVGVIPRLIDMGVEKYLIAPTLNLAMAQRLLRRLCPECKVKSKANAGESKLIQQAVDAMPADLKKKYSAGEYDIYKPNEKPCKECGGKAYKGRIAIIETLEMTDELEQLILTNMSEASIRKEGQRQGMIAMFQDGIIKVLEGMVSLEELLTVAEAGNA